MPYHHRNVQVPLAGIYAHSSLHDKRDLADLLGILRWEMILDYLSDPSVIIRVLIIEGGRQDSECQWQGTRKIEPALKMEGGHEPRNASNF